MFKRPAALFACVLATFLASPSNASPAKEEAVTIAMIIDPPAEAGIDADMLREAAEAAIHKLDPKDVRRPVSVSLVIIAMRNDPTASCNISLAVRDRKKGTILGTAMGTAQASPTAHGDQRANVAMRALTNAVGRVPDVIPAK